MYRFLPFFFLIAALISAPRLSKAQPADTVFVVTIEEMIDNGLATYVERSVAAAVEANADGIIFHIDTFGGLVDAADEIRKTILDSPVTTVAFIDKNAASAGALISLACDSIYMAPGSSMGAATVVQGQSGQKASEKMQSYMRGLMRSTAVANNRNPKLAEAMVDESIAVEGVIEEGKLLTLSNTEALQYRISNGTLANLDEVTAGMGWEGAERINIDQQWEETMLRTLANPILSSILMLMMMGGLYFELQTPGIGFGGMAAGVGALLFFAPLYIMGLAQSWEIVLFFVGVLLIFVEIFFVPGFGLPGIAGVSLMIFSLGTALIGNVGLDFPSMEVIGRAIWTLSITLILGIVMIYSIARYLPQNQRFSKLVLDTTSNRTQGYISATPQDDLVGKSGRAITALRPSGVAQIDDKRIDVVSDGGFIEQDSEVEVQSAVGSRVVVTKRSDD